MLKKNRSAPNTDVIPVLYYPDVREAVEWLTTALPFTERLRIGDYRCQLSHTNGAIVVAKPGGHANAACECGPTVGVRMFAPSSRRAAVMQGGLAVVGLLSGAVAWFQGSGIGWLVGGLLLGALVPFTLVVMMPTNRRLLDAQLDPGSREAVELLSRWGRLHAVRTVIGVVVFVSFVVMSVRT